MRSPWATSKTRYTEIPNVDVLVVCEKNSVAQAVASALSGGGYREFLMEGVRCFSFTREGRRWVVVGLRGHIMDFDFESKFNKWDSVDPEVLFHLKPIRVVRSEGWRYVEALKALGRRAEEVILALDADPEGESIAFEVMDVVKLVNPHAEFKRAWFSSVDEEELLRAFSELKKPNKLLADKCFARSIIDLTIGASFTRLLTLHVREAKPYSLPRGYFISYGPCQSPTLYLVVERALKRESFQSQRFYRVVAKLKVGDRIFEAEHVKGRFNSKEEAEGVKSRAQLSKKAVVEAVKSTRTVRAPPKPLDTVELESLASRLLNMRAKKALDVAEELYRRGFISYPRTETQIYPPSIQERLKSFIGHPLFGSYASMLLSRGAKPTAGSKDDKAHPPIHPVKAAARSEVERVLGRDGWRLYELVVRHFLATFSEPARLEGKRYTFNIGGEKFTFTTLEVVDEGFLEIYGYEYPRVVPHLPVESGCEVEVLGVEVREGQTEPPPYISESELLKLMEKWGIGTDATMQDHIQTNVERGYMYIESKRCIPTELGKKLIAQLSLYVPDLVKPEVRGDMERHLAKIAAGEEDMESVVEKAKEHFLSQYVKLKEHIHEVAQSIAEVARKSIAEVEEKKVKRRARRGKRKTSSRRASRGLRGM
ncbi:MAG: type IA DNA topoisomerase [Thermoprotei archaeon]|nr:MAG: type IA DNA topoisomerase [Thermoprotei archaeon]